MDNSDLKEIRNFLKWDFLRSVSGESFRCFTKASPFHCLSLAVSWCADEEECLLRNARNIFSGIRIKSVLTRGHLTWGCLPNEARSCRVEEQFENHFHTVSQASSTPIPHELDVKSRPWGSLPPLPRPLASPSSALFTSSLAPSPTLSSPLRSPTLLLETPWRAVHPFLVAKV